MKRPLIAKVGGSLFDLPELRERLLAWFEQQGERKILLVPGGGQSADVIRRMDEIHQLGEEKSHWLAIRMLSVNAYLQAALFDVDVVQNPTDACQKPLSKLISVLDPYPFCKADTALEHSWRVTSDSIAARIAIEQFADLALLKSVDLPYGKTWHQAAEEGLVDQNFPALVENSGLSVTWINLRRFEEKPRQ